VTNLAPAPLVDFVGAAVNPLLEIDGRVAAIRFGVFWRGFLCGNFHLCSALENLTA